MLSLYLLCNMKINTTEDLYPCDVQSLILSTFIRLILVNRSLYPYPADFFKTLGIFIPSEFNDWNFFDVSHLLRTKGLILSTDAEIPMFEKLFKDFNYNIDGDEDKKH